MKDINGLTYQDVAEISGLPVKTIERALSPASNQDIMRETARLIENAIVGSTSKYPCYLAFQEENGADEKRFNDAMRELERALADNKEYQKALDGIHTSYSIEISTIREEAQKKIDFLLEQVRHLRSDNDNLWAENNRKSKVVDMFLAKQEFLLVGNKEE